MSSTPGNVHVSTLLFLISAMGLSACGFYKKKDSTAAMLAASVRITDPVLNDRAMASLTRCQSCHTTTGTLQTLVSSGWVIPGNATGSLLYQRVHDGSMAPGNPLSTSEVTTIFDWIQKGMVLDAPLPTSSPSAAPPAGSSALAQRAFGILRTNCAGCHGTGSVGSGGIDYILDFQKLITNNLAIPGNAMGSPVYTDITGGTMPPGGRLSAADTQTIFDWIQTDLRSGAAQPMPSAIPLTKTFTSISANILIPKCTGCHGAAKADEGVRYDTYTLTLRTVTRGSPAQSKLYTECQDGSMPRGAPDLTAAELGAIRDWIVDGAPNN